MKIYVLLIISPENDIEVELYLSEIEVINAIEDYKRYKSYDGYKYTITEKYLEGELQWK